MSFAWTEVGLQDEEYPQYIELIKQEYPEWEQVRKVIDNDICGSFSSDSFLIFPCMQWMMMPDFAYTPEHIEQRMTHWYNTSKFLHYLNPLRWVGYPFALYAVFQMKKSLKQAYFADCSYVESSQQSVAVS